MDDRGATAMLSLAEAVGDELRGLDAKTALDQLESRYSDVESALTWFVDHDRAEDALRIAVALGAFWTAAGRIREGRAWFDRCLAAVTMRSSLVARALFEEGLLAFWQGDDAAATSLHDRSLVMARALDADTETALALTGLARIALRTDNARAQALSEQALATVQGGNERLGRSNALHLLGVTAQMRGDLEDAREYMTQRIEVARGLGHYGALAGEAANLSVVERQFGNLDHAESLALEALRITAQRQDEWALPYVLNALAGVAVADGRYERGATLLGAAVGIMEQQGAAWPPDERPHFERSRASAEKGLGSDVFASAWSSGHDGSLADAIAFALQE